MNEEAKDSPEMKRVKEACRVLAEHFDSVHILVTLHEGSDKGTRAIHWGEGNWFARMGQMRSVAEEMEKDWQAAGKKPDTEEN